MWLPRPSRLESLPRKLRFQSTSTRRHLPLSPSVVKHSHLAKSKRKDQILHSYLQIGGLTLHVAEVGSRIPGDLVLLGAPDDRSGGRGISLHRTRFPRRRPLAAATRNAGSLLDGSDLWPSLYPRSLLHFQCPSLATSISRFPYYAMNDLRNPRKFLACRADEFIINESH